MASSSVFQQTKSLKTALDDTTPLICEIKTAQKQADHIEYIIKVYRRPLKESAWEVTKRYSDFEKLDAQLKISNIELNLPPKKVFGNFDRDFVAERQRGLQSYLQEISTNRFISNSLIVKRFFDDKNYAANFLEIALQHVSMVFRSGSDWEVIEPLPDFGWRIRKHYILLRPKGEPKRKGLLSWVDFGPDMCIPVKELNSILKLLPNFQHPNIYPVLFAEANGNGAMLIEDFHETGSLRDMICRCKPKGNYLRKYGKPKTYLSLDLKTISTYGAQILEVLKFLHDKGFPYGHLHAGNVIVKDNNCCVLGLSSSLLGLPGYYRAFYTQMKKIQTLESIDVYSFGHVLYEMAFGEQLNTPNCDRFPLDCSPQIRSVLESILTEEACKNGLPSVTDLLSHPLFSVQKKPPPATKPVLKIPSKLKEFLRLAREEVERRVLEDNKLLKQVTRHSKIKEHHMSEEEKKKRRKSRKKAMENGESDAPATPTTPSAPTTPSTPAPTTPSTPAPSDALSS